MALLKLSLYIVLLTGTALPQIGTAARAQKKQSSHQSIQTEREAPAESKSRFFGKLFSTSKTDVAKNEKKKALEASTQSAGSTKAAHRQSDVTTSRFIDAKYLNRQFAAQRKTKGIRSVLEGKGQFIIDTAKANGIDPVFFAAAISFESGWGTSHKIRTKNNPGGLTGKGGKYASFPSLDAGIRAMASSLRTRYVNRNLKTVASIAAVYAPVGAKNDPGKTNGRWPGTVSGIMNKIMNGSRGV